MPKLPAFLRNIGNKASSSSPSVSNAGGSAASGSGVFGTSPNGTFVRQLLAMDFDHTVCDANTDVEVQDMAADGQIPGELRSRYSARGWTDFMGGVFELLHSQGVTEDRMRAYVSRLPLAPGMAQLLDAAGFDTHTDVIVISDSNVLFIDWVLERHGYRTSIDRIFSNPAQFDKHGCLRIQYYHKQDWCSLSTINLCKGHVLDEFVKDRHKRDNVRYNRIVYAGDGSNDLCAALRLQRSEDVLCARKGFKLARVIDEKKPPLKCKVVLYESGVTIAEELGLDLASDNEPQTVNSYVVWNEQSDVVSAKCN